MRTAPPPDSLAGAPQPEVPGGVLPRSWRKHSALSLLLSLALLGLLATRLDLGALLEELRRCEPGWVLLGALAHYATYPLRGLRWRRSLRHLRPSAGIWPFSLVFFFYNFVDNVVPAKLGDVYGAHLARINLGVSRSPALGSIVFLRMVDAWAVVALAVPAAWIAFAHRLPPTVERALLLGLLLAVLIPLALAVLLALHRLPERWVPAALLRRLGEFRTGLWPRPGELATIGGLTLAIWGLETLWIHWLLRAFGIELGLAPLLLVTMLPILASAFPLTPSGAGVVELTLFGVLRTLEVAAAPAASLTLINRAIDYWLHILLGILAFGFRERLGLRTWREGDSEVATPAAGVLVPTEPT